MREIIQSADAPEAIGTYSQAVKVNQTVYLSGQIPLDPKTMTLVSSDFTAQATQVFNNIKAVATAANGSLQDIVKLTIYLTDLNDFAKVNEVMSNYFTAPYPARVTLQVSALPKAAQIEVDAIMVLP